MNMDTEINSDSSVNKEFVFYRNDICDNYLNEVFAKETEKIIKSFYNYKPQFKRRAPSKFKDRDAILNRIQGIVYKGKIVFKDLNNKEVKIY